ncbi:unnamed protein product [Acanthoscelides obtectus]|uniref:Putative nuclease HARBI1 n=1 Tax=Acanthoscelides obtectus TaxID=200917 RepID=A0A9P0LR91_ACAOB|nr:unnamed protein product [Acanthoscelides obtectus]CAK1686007.1 Putative nuclease HARBI1 [Acanthoscelides obtectus]
MRVFLRYVGDPGFQIGIGDGIGIHQSTVSRTVTNVITRIVQKSNIWIRFPTSCEDLHNAKNKWQEKFNFPSAIGAIDSTDIPIMKPFIHADEYVNRKNFASINIQATCNSNEEFISVDVSWPGFVLDSRIWKNSDLYNVMKLNRASAVLLGVSRYGIAPLLMTPFRIAETAEQRSYNRLFTRERVIIERCFGQLKQRFPILHNKIRFDTEKVSSLVMSCFILHNVAKHLNDEDFAVDIPGDGEQEEIHNQHTADYADGVIRQRGQFRRDAMSRIILGVRV